MRRSRWMMKAVPVTLLALMAPVFGPGTVTTAQAAPAPPAATTSRYETSTDYSTLYNQGCAQGGHSESGKVVLDFGEPWFAGSTYGTIIFGSYTFRSISQIESGVRGWLAGYWNCSPSAPFVYLSVGTTNYHGYTTYGHGQAWAQMVARLQNFIVSPPTWGSQLTARGAIDMETSWNTPTNSRNWANGYASVSGSTYYNYGDAGGCPPYGSCNNGWTQEDVWYVSWGAQPAWPVPEIYYSANATQWYQLSLYSALRHGGSMYFLGAMTEHAADPSTNTPAQGWSQLWTALNSDSRTAQGLGAVTDITWAN